KKTALLLAAIMRLCEGDVSKFLPPSGKSWGQARLGCASLEPVPVFPEEIKRFLDSGPSMGARRAALVAILESIIADEVDGPQGAGV
ncbi:hypothetical protein LCGC14_3019900, partial [marine sediment metagenome]